MGYIGKDAGIVGGSGLLKQLPMTDSEFKKIRELIYKYAGIVLSDQKQDMVYGRLSRRLKSLDLSTFSHYIQFLESPTGKEEKQLFINSLTTNLTSFFREAYHFPILAKHARAQRGNYTVWSTASSTGEEPYSIAITLDEALGGSAVLPRITATDIDTQVLNIAEQGIYRAEDIARLDPAQKKKYFLRGAGEQSGLVKVRKELMRDVTFNQMNLMDTTWPLQGKFDAIFCRNVMIYFDKASQQKILKRFAKMLKPNGLLFAGHSEQVSQLSDEFYSRGQSVFGLIGEK